MKESTFQTELVVIKDGKRINVSKSRTKGFLSYFIGNEEKEIRIPFKSFVKQFMDLLYEVLSNATPGIVDDNIPLTTYGIASSKEGILLYSSNTGAIKNASDVWNTAVSTGVVRTNVTYNVPIKPGDIVITKSGSTGTAKFSFTRTIQNSSTTSNVNAKDILVVGKYVSGTASGRKLLSRDTEQVTIKPSSSITVVFGMQFQRSLVTGGEKANLLQLILNTLMQGNTSPYNKLGTWTSGYTAYTLTSGANHYMVDAAANEFYGIVVGTKYNNTSSTGDPVIEGGVSNVVIDISSNNDQYEMVPLTTELSSGYAAVTVNTAALASDGASITISRVITNNSSVSQKIERIGLFSKGATAGTSGVHAGSACLVMNATDLVLAPAQSITVQYILKVTT